MLTILTLPQNEKPLRQKSAPLTADQFSDPSLQKFFRALAKKMFLADGAGLAAPQVGRLLRVIAINLNKSPLIMINPQITKKSWSKNILEEGCLSVPGIYAKVKRHTYITAEYQDIHGQKISAKFSHFPARVIQHEIDHLDGILFIDKIVK
jgi:peptide deformylase